ncbi:MAG: DUF4377 domain-containing protein [Bacteroidetes bacterium]|nr:DUF4377 domain-containing protein [Bacteroidota bacterium]
MRSSVYFIILISLFSSFSCGHTSRTNTANMKLKIYPYKVPCTGEDVRLCMRVEKEGQSPEYFYDTIEGFTYQWGYWYTLEAEPVQQMKPAADASSVSYRLTKMVQKKWSTDSFSLPLRMNDQALVKKKEGSCSFFNDIMIQSGSAACAKLLRADTAWFRVDKNSGTLVVLSVK